MLSSGGICFSASHDNTSIRYSSAVTPLISFEFVRDPQDQLRHAKSVPDTNHAFFSKPLRCGPVFYERGSHWIEGAALGLTEGLNAVIISVIAAFTFHGHSAKVCLWLADKGIWQTLRRHCRRSLCTTDPQEFQSAAASSNLAEVPQVRRATGKGNVW